MSIKKYITIELVLLFIFLLCNITFLIMIFGLDQQKFFMDVRIKLNHFEGVAYILKTISALLLFLFFYIKNYYFLFGKKTESTLQFIVLIILQLLVTASIIGLIYLFSHIPDPHIDCDGFSRSSSIFNFYGVPFPYADCGTVFVPPIPSL